MQFQPQSLFSKNQSKMISFKIKSEEEVRRFCLLEGEDLYERLVDQVGSLFETTSFSLWYVDDEGDRIEIGSESELSAAMGLMPKLIVMNFQKKEDKPQEGSWDGHPHPHHGHPHGHPHGRPHGRSHGHGHHGHHGRHHGRGWGRGCGRGHGFPLGGGGAPGPRLKHKLGDVTVKLSKVDAKLATGSEDVELLWKKKRLESKKAFLLQRMEAWEEGTADREEMMREGLKMRFEMVSENLQYLDTLLQSDSGNQFLQLKKEKFEKKKAFLEHRMNSPQQMTPRGSGEKGLAWRLQKISDKLEEVKEQREKSGSDKGGFKEIKLEQKKKFLQLMVENEGRFTFLEMLKWRHQMVSAKVAWIERNMEEKPRLKWKHGMLQDRLRFLEWKINAMENPHPEETTKEGESLEETESGDLTHSPPPPPSVGHPSWRQEKITRKLANLEEKRNAGVMNEKKYLWKKRKLEKKLQKEEFPMNHLSCGSFLAAAMINHPGMHGGYWRCSRGSPEGFPPHGFPPHLHHHGHHPHGRHPHGHHPHGHHPHGYHHPQQHHPQQHHPHGPPMGFAPHHFGSHPHHG